MTVVPCSNSTVVSDEHGLFDAVIWLGLVLSSAVYPSVLSHGIGRGFVYVVVGLSSPGRFSSADTACDGPEAFLPW
jgi:hypothetical protein